ncbi:MAG: acyl-CoA dehydrogenase family protein [Bacteroidia bacterium]|nr:acyl-CoA dehydrogenase family protein [Bacteroidia bacterium]
MQTIDLTQKPQDLNPNILAFLPVLYMAWSDEVLTPGEIRLIEQKIARLEGIDEDERGWLQSKLDPQNPPTPQEFKRWLHIVEEGLPQLPEQSKVDLMVLSKAIATLGVSFSEEKYKGIEAEEALREIEEAAGWKSDEAIKDIFLDNQTSKKVEPYEIQFDPRILEEILDGPYREIRQRMRALLSDPFFSYEKISRVKEEYRELVLEWLKELASRGLGSLAFPEAYGGKNDMGAYIAVFEMLGHHDMSLQVKFGVQFGLFAGSILGLGTESHHKTYLPGAGTVNIPGCFAMTEAGHGSNVRDLETTATYDPEAGEFIIHTPHYHAHKEYIGNAAAHARLAVVFAQLHTQGESFGVHAFVVPVRDEDCKVLPGVTIGDTGQKLGLNGVDNGRLWFNQVRIPRKNLLDRFGQVREDGTYFSPIPSEGRRFFTMLSTLVGGRVAVPVGGLSAAKSGLSIALRYAAKRRQFGRAGEEEMPILEYPTHQLRLIPRLAKTYALHFGHRFMIDKYINHTEEEAREIEALAAGLKAVSTWHTTDTLQECREATGGQGYLAVNRFADMKADSDIYTTFEGDNYVLLQLVAKSQLSNFRAGFRSLNFFGILNTLANRAAQTLVDKNPLAKSKANPEYLRSADFQLEAFKDRENDIVWKTAREMKRLIDGGMDSFDAFLEVQPALLEMAKAYIHRVVIEQFILAVQAVDDPATKAILDKLRALYGLSELAESRGWYLEEGYFDGGKAKAIKEEVIVLCKEIKPQVVGLVDAFGIPDALLAAPIILGVK